MGTGFLISKSLDYALSKLKCHTSDISIVSTRVINGITPRLQKNYGDSNDCVIVSIATMLSYYLKETDFETIYNQVLKNTPPLVYTPQYGTFTVFNGSIINKTIEDFKLNKKSKSMMVKELGYDFETIKSIINNNKPIVLSMSSSNGGYYKMHAVNIIGYMEYHNKKNGEKLILLMVYDNWNTSKRFIDYSTIHKLSMINYIT